MQGSRLAIGWDIFGKLRENIDFDSYSKSFLLTDGILFDLYSAKIGRVFKDELESGSYHVLKAGVGNKSLEKVGEVCQKMLQSNMDKRSVLVALGGSTVCDTGGLAASLFIKGIDFITIPTTLAGQVDWALREEYTIDLGNARDIMGLFSPPARVVIDPTFLDTLNRSQMADGMTAFLKISAAADSHLFEKLESIGFNFVGVDDSEKLELISRAAHLKLALTGRDAGRHAGPAISDLGGTVGRASETLAGERKLTQGQLSAIGMMVAVELSGFLCGLGEKEKERLKKGARSILGDDLSLDIEHAKVWEAIISDPERDPDNISFVLLESIGNPVVKTIIKDQFLTAYKTIERELKT